MRITITVPSGAVLVIAAVFGASAIINRSANAATTSAGGTDGHGIIAIFERVAESTIVAVSIFSASRQRLTNAGAFFDASRFMVGCIPVGRQSAIAVLGAARFGFGAVV